MNFRSLYKIALIIIAMVLPLASYSQCKNFVKKQCMPRMAPFTHNGQLNSATLMEGETAELQMTFYSGQNYRILVCAEDALGKTQFVLLDGDHKTVFNSKDNGFPSFWDFNVNSTQQLTIQVVIPKSSSPNAIVKSGCVTVLAGFKQ